MTNQYKKVKVTITNKELFSTYIALLTDTEINDLIWEQQIREVKSYNLDIELLS